MSNNSAGHKYTVEFRIYGDGLQPDVITKELGLQPCQTRVAGEGGAREQGGRGMWAYDGSDGGKVEWENLEDGMNLILDKLWKKLEAIQRYRARMRLIWWCANFQSSFDGGPTLSHALLVRLAEIGADIFIDNYFCESDKQTNADQ
jgi:hypothetical protein